MEFYGFLKIHEIIYMCAYIFVNIIGLVLMNPGVIVKIISFGNQMTASYFQDDNGTFNLMNTVHKKTFRMIMFYKLWY